MQGIYTYIPEAFYVLREYSVAAVLLFLFVVLILLVSVLNLWHFYISTSRNMCAVSNMAVFCSFIIIIIIAVFLNPYSQTPFQQVSNSPCILLLDTESCELIISDHHQTSP